ncbi:glycosyltransferase [Dermatophilus congolensis]|uniref:tetratricopeptide repeat-containing glycosyltransferase n=1 Tax=Dermatophilus congolensis TaxID=1863 RepID=UPI001AAFAD0A|nr:glycosyltransferase [Dermatophilus congolensis]MBO3206524.1 glycosyltransferase [Dermatophilus congolensis]
MTTPRLAAVLIVKDEEKNLPGCLESLNTLRPLLHEIIVYDTGSTDATIDIATHAGAAVHRGSWNGDFSHARNKATSYTDATWVLSIDADERVIANTSLLASALTTRRHDIDVFHTTILDIGPSGTPIAQHPFSKLFRPSRAHWAGTIHEGELSPDILHLRHHGYAEKTIRDTKATRNATVAHAGRTRHHTNTALPVDQRVKLMIDEARALVADNNLDHARDLFDIALHTHPISTERRIQVLHEAISFHLIDKQFTRAEEEITELHSLGAPTDAVTWLKANLLVDSGHPREAMTLLKTLKSVRLSRTLELDGSFAVALLMRAAVDAGEFDEALACAIQLVAHTGDVPRFGRQLLRLWGDQPPELLAQLLREVAGPHIETIRTGLAEMPAPGPQVAHAL